jgi:hypothetical protein
MGDGHGNSGFVGEALNVAFPAVDAGAIAAAAIGDNGEASGLGIGRLAEPLHQQRMLSTAKGRCRHRSRH